MFLRYARKFRALTFVNAKNLHISNIGSTFAPHFWDGETQRDTTKPAKCIREKSEQHGNRAATVPKSRGLQGQSNGNQDKIFNGWPTP